MQSSTGMSFGRTRANSRRLGIHCQENTSGLGLFSAPPPEIETGCLRQTAETQQGRSRRKLYKQRRTATPFIDSNPRIHRLALYHPQT